ncbi:MAG: nickel-dependent lactate racemase, partial [Prolixibacteraceae bacterium]|nr:nickel-dependent lactate racemase [Prolixibacteraceae bacterium]
MNNTEKDKKIIPVHYGKRLIDLSIPSGRLAFNLKANAFSPPEDEQQEIRRALREPLGCGRLKDIVSPDASVVILGDDYTRVTPQDRIIPLILDELNEAGVSNDQIKIIIAYGTHRPMSEDEIEKKYGRELMKRVTITGHDCHNNLVDKGVTRRGTHIIVNKEVLEADFRIAVGGVLPHHPVGWSGGAKMLLPGIAGVKTTNAMHLLGATEQQLGKIITPCRDEMEDFAREVGLHFILNVLQTENGELLKAVSGHFIDAHREAVSWGEKIYGVPFKERADITISSAYPADYDLTQADKGLFSAELATKPGGEIILLSPCEEGIAPT